MNNGLISITQKGELKTIIDIFNGFHKKSKVSDILLDEYGRRGCEILRQYTPKRTGLTSQSWSYKIIRKLNTTELAFYNSNVQDGVNIAIILQYGHATGLGYWVQGRDYINPAVRPIMDDLAKEAWEEVVKT